MSISAFAIGEFSGTSATATTLLERFCGMDEAGSVERTLLVSAHPGDESAGAGCRLRRLGDAQFLCVTDGAPRKPSCAQAAGFTGRGEYAVARADELRQALRWAGHAPSRLTMLGIPDQEASLHLASLARRIARQICAWQPEVVVTHPYEGGHPDHDATAFAVHAACLLAERRGAVAPAIIEMTSYHNCGGNFVFGEFLPGGTRPEIACSLGSAERAFKRRLLECHATQRRVLSGFPLDRECFRLAPEYDFLAPPHDGTLLYELFPWEMTSVRWRSLAQSALQALDLAPAPAA